VCLVPQGRANDHILVQILDKIAGNSIERTNLGLQVSLAAYLGIMETLMAYEMQILLKRTRKVCELKCKYSYCNNLIKYVLSDEITGQRDSK
jgi:hypothetical protein